MSVPPVTLTPVTSPLPEITRARTAARTGPSFAEVLKGSLGLVLTGATAATGPVGSALVASAVRTGGLPPMTGLGAGGTGVAGAGGVTGATSTGSLAGVGTSGDGDLMQQMQALQAQSRDMNLEMLALQEEVQQENRRFSTASNVLKARHDTAKAAIGNIRP